MIKRNVALELKEIIEKNPGIQFRELMRLSGFTNGTVTRYTNKLEENKSIKIVRESHQTRFYSPKITKKESIVIKSLRKSTPRDIILALLNEDRLDFSQIVNIVSKSPGHVSRSLSKIVNDDLVEIIVTDKKRYSIKSRKLVSELIKDNRPELSK